MLTVVLWLWNGWRPAARYNADKVNTCARMLRANISMPHRIVCLAEPGLERGITECDDVKPLWGDFQGQASVGRTNCFRRLRLFDPRVQDAIGGDWFLSFDIDAYIERSMDPLLTLDAPFRIRAGDHARYNGSMYLLQHGAMRHVYDNYDPRLSPKQIRFTRHKGKRIVGSDQAWLSITAGDVPTWTQADGVKAFSRDKYDQHAHNAIVWFFEGATKPWDKKCKEAAPVLYHKYRQYERALTSGC